MDAQLSTTTGLAVQLAFSVEHRFRLELHGDGPLAGAHGRVTSEFVVAEDGTVAEHDVVVLLNPDDPGGHRP